MYSWMSAFIITLLLLFSISCVPPAYRSKPDTSRDKHNYYKFEQPEEYTPFQDDTMYIQKNKKDTTMPVCYDKYSKYEEDDTKHIMSDSYQHINPVPENNSKSGIWHTVKKGETLYRLSKKYAVSINDIQTMNNITNPTAIKAGQRILIPISDDSADCGINKQSKISKGATKKSISKPLFMWPVTYVAGVGRDNKNGARPIGILIKSTPKSNVMASAHGTIVKIGSMRGFGNFVVIQHKKDFYTIYSKLDAIRVKEGQVVGCGTTIGILDATNPSLHFQINQSGKPLDPLMYLAKK